MIRRVFLAVLIVSTLSCSNDDKMNGDEIVITPESTSGLKIKTMIETVYLGAKQINKVTDFTYQEGKLVSMVNPELNRTIKCIYEGHRIMRFEIYNGSTLIDADIVVYNGDKLVCITNEKSKREYEYQSDGNIKSIRLLQKSNGVWKEVSNYSYVFDQNDNVAVWKGPNAEEKRINTKHDDKKNPFSGMNPYLKYYFFSNKNWDVFDKNNVTEQEYMLSSTNSKWTVFYRLQYNKAGYPTEILRSFDNENVFRSKVKIIYN